MIPEGTAWWLDCWKKCLLAGWCAVSGQALGEGLREPLDVVCGAMTLERKEWVSGGKMRAARW